jgi:hypothetical protein
LTALRLLRNWPLALALALALLAVRRVDAAEKALLAFAPAAPPSPAAATPPGLPSARTHRVGLLNGHALVPSQTRGHIGDDVDWGAALVLRIAPLLAVVRWEFRAAHGKGPVLVARLA